MIELVGVSKSYATPFGRKVVLDGVDAYFEPNVSVGILGRNGDHLAALGADMHLRRVLPGVMEQFGHRI